MKTLNKIFSKFLCSIIHVNRLTPVNEEYVWYCKKCGITFKYSNGTTDTGPR